METTKDRIRDMDTNQVCKAIKVALGHRSIRPCSVTHGKGTSCGWITIQSPPSRRNEHGTMTEADRIDLGQLLGLDKPCHHQGESIPSGNDYYAEYLDRAEGRTPEVQGKPYWD